MYIYIYIYVKPKSLQAPWFSTSSFFFLKKLFLMIYCIRIYQFWIPIYTTPPAFSSPFFLSSSSSSFFFKIFYYYIIIYQFRTSIQLYNSLFSLHVKVKVLNPKPLCSLIYASTPKPRSSHRHRHHGSLPLHRFLFAFPLSLNPAHRILCRQIILR